MPKPLDARERRFVEEYLVSLDPKEAALAAGYSKTVAASKAYQWVSNSKVKPHVFAAIEEAQKARSIRTNITADRVLEEYARIGFSDIRAAFTENGHLRGIAALDDDTARAVASVEVVTRPSGEVDEAGNREVEYVHKLKFWDKKGALDSVAKHLGMFVERHEIGGKNGGPIQTEDVSALTPVERAQRLAAIIAAGKAG